MCNWIILVFNQTCIPHDSGDELPWMKCEVLHLTEDIKVVSGKFTLVTECGSSADDHQLTLSGRQNNPGCDYSQNGYQRC